MKAHEHNVLIFNIFNLKYYNVSQVTTQLDQATNFPKALMSLSTAVYCLSCVQG